jgi:hypothetical protein
MKINTSTECTTNGYKSLGALMVLGGISLTSSLGASINDESLLASVESTAISIKHEDMGTFSDVSVALSNRINHSSDTVLVELFNELEIRQKVMDDDIIEILSTQMASLYQS